MAAACCAAQAVTVKPENTDEILVNPDLGLVMFHYSNRQWAYGQLQERGDTLDWFPGVSTIYFRLPWWSPRVRPNWWSKSGVIPQHVLTC